ncbi:MAG: phosphoglyceromutase [Acidobacteria bacterium]|nr:phosphoglyceromutase [Acidobacteriota bacterium]
MRKTILILSIALLFASNLNAQYQTENVILITLDGVRHQEIFTGLDAQLYKAIDKDAGEKAIFRKFSAATPSERRAKLMPFFWNVWMKSHGSIAGNISLKSEVKTTNNMLFSYPGYSEILTGEAHDDVIKSNARVQNRFPSYLQFLQKKLNLNANQVAAFASWDAFNEIVTSDPNAFLVNAGYEECKDEDPAIQHLSRLQFETPTPFDTVRHDFYTFQLALAHMKKYGPRVTYIGLGETDDWAHVKRYDLVLNALHRTDNYFKELWEFVQTDERYRGKTSIIVTVDHGRGDSAEDWHDHGSDVPEARNIWTAFISPDVELRGEWRNSKTIYQNQIAATLTRLMGFDYSGQNLNAGKPIKKVFENQP